MLSGFLEKWICQLMLRSLHTARSLWIPSKRVKNFSLRSVRGRGSKILLGRPFNGEEWKLSIYQKAITPGAFKVIELEVGIQEVGSKQQLGQCPGNSGRDSPNSFSNYWFLARLLLKEWILYSTRGQIRVPWAVGKVVVWFTLDIRLTRFRKQNVALRTCCWWRQKSLKSKQKSNWFWRSTLATSVDWLMVNLWWYPLPTAMVVNGRALRFWPSLTMAEFRSPGLWF